MLLLPLLLCKSFPQFGPAIHDYHHDDEESFPVSVQRISSTSIVDDDITTTVVHQWSSQGMISSRWKVSCVSDQHPQHPSSPLPQPQLVPRQPEHRRIMRHMIGEILIPTFMVVKTIPILLAMMATTIVTFGTATLPAYAVGEISISSSMMMTSRSMMVQLTDGSSSKERGGDQLFTKESLQLASSSSSSSSLSPADHPTNNVGRLLLLDGRQNKARSTSARVIMERQATMQDRRLEQCKESGKNWEQCFYYGGTEGRLTINNDGVGRGGVVTTAVDYDDGSNDTRNPPATVDPAKMRSSTKNNIIPSKKVPTW